MFTYFNPDTIASIPSLIKTASSGFRFGYVKNIFKDEAYERLIAAFPDVRKFKLVDKQSGGGRKRFYIGPDYYSGKAWGCPCDLSSTAPIWQAVMRESASPEFMAALSATAGVKFNSLCNFGFTYGNEGCVQEAHIDGAVRPGDPGPTYSTFAGLLYFNRAHGGSTGTCVYDIDRTTVLAQADDLQNSMFFFEQHPDAWHGFPVVPPGEDRRLVSLAYSQETPPIILKTSPLHPFVCGRRWKMVAKQILK